MKVDIIEVDTIAEKQLDKPLTLEQMQALVGGLIEVVYLNNDIDSPFKTRTMIVNEDGIGLELPFNPLASAIAEQPIVGTVLVLDYELD